MEQLPFPPRFRRGQRVRIVAGVATHLHGAVTRVCRTDTGLPRTAIEHWRDGWHYCLEVGLCWAEHELEPMEPEMSP